MIFIATVCVKLMAKDLSPIHYRVTNSLLRLPMDCGRKSKSWVKRRSTYSVV